MDADIFPQKSSNPLINSVRTYEYNYNGKKLTIIVGEKAQENWDIIKKANQKDIWLHLDKHSSPHVIIKYDKKIKINNKIIKYAAELCKTHSKFKNLNKVSVIYTEIKNVKRGTEVGSVTTKNTTKIVV